MPDAVGECLAVLDRVLARLTQLQAGVRRLVGDLELVEIRVEQLATTVEEAKEARTEFPDTIPEAS